MADLIKSHKNKLCGAWSKLETECIRKKGHKGLHSDEERDREIWQKDKVLGGLHGDAKSVEVQGW